MIRATAGMGRDFCPVPGAVICGMRERMRLWPHTLMSASVRAEPFSPFNAAFSYEKASDGCGCRKEVDCSAGVRPGTHRRLWGGGREA